MEHLTRNTNNDRLINAINSIKSENASILSKELRDLADRIVTVFAGILSSLISGVVIAAIKQEKVQLKSAWIILFFLVLLLIIWFFCIKFLIPALCKLLFIEKINIAPKETIFLVNQFNCEIMQKVAEVNQIVGVIRETNIKECKILNFVMALYKLQEIVDFLYNNFYNNNNKIRKSSAEGSPKLLRYSFNRYTVSAVVMTVLNIRDVMDELIEKDCIIKNVDGFDLLKEDFNDISRKIYAIKDI